MNRTQIIDHLHMGRPVTAKLVSMIIKELEKAQRLEEALREIRDECSWQTGCGDDNIGRIVGEALEAAC